VTLAPCYRASCDAPDCTASEMLPHARTGPVRSQLAALGWTVLHVRGPARGGAARILYACPEHRSWAPPDALPRVGVSVAEQRRIGVRRAAIFWMLRQAGVSNSQLAAAAGLSVGRVIEIVKRHERMVERKQREAAYWPEPWARRLRAAGAIR
jgi:hypothetical protein